MAIYVQQESGPTQVLRGFAKRLKFTFWPYHEDGDDVLYHVDGLHQVAVAVKHSEWGEAFVGWGQVITFNGTGTVRDQRLNPVKSRPHFTDTPRWEVQVELSSMLISEIDSARRESADATVEFVFDWYVVARRERWQNGSVSQGDTGQHPVMMRPSPGRSQPPTVSMTFPQWFKITEAYGFPGRRHIELVFPPVDTDRWQRAVNALAQADRDFDQRRDRQCMDYCEQALQEVFGRDVVMATPEVAAAKATDVLKAWGFDEERKRNRVRDLVVAALLFARRGKHDVDTAGYPGFDPTSGDAEVGLLTTKAVLGFLSKQATKPEVTAAGGGRAAGRRQRSS